MARSSSSSSAAASSPRYNVVLNDTLAHETHGKSIHFIVVKNTPFVINISARDTPSNFRKAKVTASLAYDCEPRREVTLIRSSPLEYVTHISSNGELITIEARIHVLTSQNENSLFRVCVKLNDDELVTEPLKVISKADNLKKAKDKSSAGKKKRTSDDAFGDTLQRIEQQQQEQKGLIDMLYQQNQLLMTHIQQQPSSPSSPLRSPSSPQLPISSPSSPDPDAPSAEHKLHNCINAFRHFLDCYKNLSTSTEERPHKVRLLTQIASPVEQDVVASFAKDFLTARTADACASTPSSLLSQPLSFPLPVDSIFDSDVDAASPQVLPSPDSDGRQAKFNILGSPEAPSSSSLLGSWLELAIDDHSTRVQPHLIVKSLALRGGVGCCCRFVVVVCRSLLLGSEVCFELAAKKRRALSYLSAVVRRSAPGVGAAAFVLRVSVVAVVVCCWCHDRSACRSCHCLLCVVYCNPVLEKKPPAR